MFAFFERTKWPFWIVLIFSSVISSSDMLKRKGKLDVLFKEKDQRFVV